MDLEQQKVKRNYSRREFIKVPESELQKVIASSLSKIVTISKNQQFQSQCKKTLNIRKISDAEIGIREMLQNFELNNK